VTTKTTSQGHSTMERLAEAIEWRAELHARNVVTYAHIVAVTDDSVIAFVMRLIQEDEQRHRALVGRIATTMRDALNWTQTSNALPSPRLPSGHLTEQLAATAQNALDEARADSLSARKLAEAFSGINGGLDAVLLESIAERRNTHAQLLRFILQRLRSGSAKRRLLAHLRADRIPSGLAARNESAAA
jgi:hypothetical protein